MDEISNIIFTKDGNYAYKLRSKLNDANIKIDYVRDAESLLYYIFNNTKGIVLLDLKYARFVTIIKEYSHHQYSRNFCFIFLTDNKNCEVEYDNKMIFVTNYENLLPTFMLASKALEKREELRQSIPDSYIDKYLIEMLRTFKISTKHAGYSLIKDAIKILVNKNRKTNIVIKDVYEEIGQLCGKTPANIEKCIRLALTRAKETAPDTFQEYFKQDRISNAILLNFIAENIRISYYSSAEYKLKISE